MLTLHSSSLSSMKPMRVSGRLLVLLVSGDLGSALLEDGVVVEAEEERILELA